MNTRNWRLPAGVDELLPPAAWALEQVRRRVLDVFHSWGFEYIDPPIIEYLDALLVGSGDDMDLQTLKVIDQRSGRLLGVRADMTAQAVRIDAHSLPVEGVQRLCYAGNVVLANPLGPLDTRVPLKAGAELFGAPTLAADAEVVALMLEVLSCVGIEDPILVLGHMGIFQNLIADLDLSEAQLADLFTAVQSKAEDDIQRLLQGQPQRQTIARLSTLMGERGVLSEARICLESAGAGVLGALDELETLAELVQSRCPGARLRFDLAELVGYGYHNGAVFSAYHADHGRALARGGRYDGIGEDFGRSRAATGFDVSLKELVVDVQRNAADVQRSAAIWAPWVLNDASQNTLLETSLRDRVRLLREDGESVVVALSAQEAAPPRCDRQLEHTDGDWIIVERTE